jgi:hypothetical protein
VLVVTNAHTYRLLVPKADAYRISTALSGLARAGQEAFSFGPARMVRRVIDHVLALPAAALNPEQAVSAGPNGTEAAAAVDKRVESLEEQVQELHDQVRFLEGLLRQRQMKPDRPLQPEQQLEPDHASE